MTDDIKNNSLAALYNAQREYLKTLTDGRGDYLRPVFGEGIEDASVVFIGEAPGASEVEMGRPFVGKAGLQLNHMLELSGIDRSLLYVTNTIKYRPWSLTATARGLRPRNRVPIPSEIRLGADLLREELLVIRPRIIVTLGNTPLSAIRLLTDCSFGSIGEVHGTAIEIDEFNTVLFPLYHPASGIYNKSLVPIMEKDLVKLKQSFSNYFSNTDASI